MPPPSRKPPASPIPRAKLTRDARTLTGLAARPPRTPPSGGKKAKP